MFDCRFQKKINATGQYDGKTLAPFHNKDFYILPMHKGLFFMQFLGSDKVNTTKQLNGVMI